MSLAEAWTESKSSENSQMSGVVVGLVTHNQDPEKLGRVKICFPWRKEPGQGYWARLASPMAGNGRGMIFLPEVKDEVLVAFERGDINHPYIIGVLWNGVDRPPETNADGKNNIRKITSRSGHEIIFNDNAAQQQERLEIHTKSGHKIVLDDSSGKEKIEISDKSGQNKMVIDSMKNSIEMESLMQLKLKANMVEIEGTATLTLKSTGMVNVQGMPIKLN